MHFLFSSKTKILCCKFLLLIIIIKLKPTSKLHIRLKVYNPQFLCFILFSLIFTFVTKQEKIKKIFYKLRYRELYESLTIYIYVYVKLEKQVEKS